MEHSASPPNYALRWAIPAGTVIAAVLWLGPFILRPDLYANDAAQHIFWLYRYADPALFANDLTARFFSLPSSAPWGYRGLYAALAPWVDVLLAAEVMVIVLLAAAVWLGGAIGRAVVPSASNELAGLIGALAVLWLIAQRADVMTPLGLQRSFALPITLLFLWALLARRYFWVGVAWLLTALFYPVIVVVLGVAGAAVFLRDLVRDRRLPAFWAWNLAAGIVAVAVVAFSSTVPPDIGPTLSGAQALSMPEFSSAGRLRLFFGSARADWFRNQLMGIGWSPLTVLTIAAAAVVASCGDRRARLPQSAWIFLVCGLGIWILARFNLFTLYLPNRHARWTLAAFGVAALAPAGVIVMEGLLARIRNFAWDSWRTTAVILSAALLLVFALFFPAAQRVWARPVDADMERAYAYLATLPRDTLIAAHPDIANFVPLRAHRSVLASTETALPFMSGYYRVLKPRLEASLRAAYASNWQDLEAVLAPYGVRVMLSAPAVWAKTRYYEPFEPLVAGLRSRGERQGFVLQHPDPARVLFRSGEVYVVRVGRDLE